MKNRGKPFGKGKFSSSKGEKKKDGKDSQERMCYECNGHGHLKKELPNYLRGKGKVFATTFSDFECSNSDAEGECDSEGNYSTFMAITMVDSRDDLSNLVCIPKVRKLKIWKMRMCTSMKVRRTFRKCMILC